MTKEEENIHRMEMIIDDAKAVINHIQSNKGLETDTMYGATLETHLENIKIALDMSSDESLTWSLYKTRKLTNL